VAMHAAAARRYAVIDISRLVLTRH
jgi:hypothetical protein